MGVREVGKPPTARNYGGAASSPEMRSGAIQARSRLGLRVASSGSFLASRRSQSGDLQGWRCSGAE